MSMSVWDDFGGITRVCAYVNGASFLLMVSMRVCACAFALVEFVF